MFKEIIDGIKLFLCYLLLIALCSLVFVGLESIFGKVSNDGCSPSNTSEC